MKRIILIGYMGAGKTTIGRQLAMALGLQFYDLDWYIEMRASATWNAACSTRWPNSKMSSSVAEVALPALATTWNT